MTALNHAATGVLIAAAVDHPYLALPAAFLSHFAIDMLPHWDYKVPRHIAQRNVIIGLDISLAFIILIIWSFLLGDHPWILFLGGLLAILPDMMWLPYILHQKPIPKDSSTLLNRLRRFHLKIQWSESSKGLIFEAVWFVFIVFLIYKVV